MSLRSPIGIEVTARTISAVQMDRLRRRVVAAALVDRPPGAQGLGPDEADRLDSVLFRQGFTGRDLALCVPDGKLMTSVLELPPRASGAPLEQLARVELARQHKKEPGSFEMACWDVPAPTRTADCTYMMAAACTHEDAEGLLDVFEGVGFRVVALDAKPWALTRACGRIVGGAATAALLELGESAAMLTVVRDGVPVYERLMREAGVEALRSRVGRELSLEADVADYVLETPAQEGEGGDGSARAGVARMVSEHLEGLCTEVRAALEYVAHRYPGEVGLMGIMGRGTALVGLVEQLGRAFDMPVRLARPAELAECPAVLSCCADPALTGALGLAMWRRAA